jgi:hypothetical protein
MAVPVSFGYSSFDYRPMRAEQARLSRNLVLPSPRDKDDTAQVLEIEDDQVTPFKYPTFIKVRYDKEGTLPIFELWLKDNFDQEYKVSKERVRLPGGALGPIPGGIGTTTKQINDDPLTAAGPLSDVNDSFAVNTLTGDIYRNAYWDSTQNLIIDAAGLDPSDPAFAGDLVGNIKYDGVTGLALAAVNSRIADISNSIEGVTKVLSVAISNLDAVFQVIR